MELFKSLVLVMAYGCEGVWKRLVLAYGCEGVWKGLVLATASGCEGV